MEGGSEYKKGLWTEEEDKILTDYIRVHGKGKWNRVAKITGLKRCGKSCRLRWINYLSPSVKRDDFTKEEDDLIIRLHNLLGNRWSLIAGRVPGRTDNQVKNHWNTHLSKKLGVRKGKSKSKAGASSRTLLPKESGEILSNPSESNSAIPPSSNGRTVGREVTETEPQPQSPKELFRNDDYENSFWFSISDDLINLQVPNLMDHLDKSLDFLWHGL